VVVYERYENNLESPVALSLFLPENREMEFKFVKTFWQTLRYYIPTYGLKKAEMTSEI
jgi:hypothetical protein